MSVNNPRYDYSSGPGAGTSSVKGVSDSASMSGVASTFLGPVGAIGAGVAGLGDAIGGLFGGGGGSSQKSGYTIPPEYELQFLQQFQNQFSQMQSDYQTIGAAYNAYNDKIGALNNIIEKGYSPENFQAIQQSNFQLGQTLGMDAQTMAKNGFITSKDQQDMQYMQGLIQGHGQGGTKNQALEDQIGNQKRQLEQDLARGGVSPAQRAGALAQFEQSANQQRDQNSQQEFGQMSQLLAQRSGLRQQGYNQATNTLNQGMNMGNQYMAGYQQLGQNYAGQQNAAQNMLQLQQGLRGEANQNFQLLGQMNLSKTTSNFIKGGGASQWGGPGSYGSQTGIPRNQTGSFASFNQGQENQLFGNGYDIKGLGYQGQNFQNMQFDRNVSNAQKRQAYQPPNTSQNLATDAIGRNFLK